MSNHQISPSSEQQSPANELDRRRKERFRCNRQARWRICGTRSAGSWRASIHDISCIGISLAVDTFLEAGMILEVRIERSEQETCLLPQPVRVRHVRSLPNGRWVIGCRFVKRLTDEELQSIISTPDAD